MVKKEEFKEKTEKLLSDLADYTIEKLKFGKFDIKSLDDLVDSIYNEIMSKLKTEDMLVVKDHKAKVCKDNKVINDFSADVNGTFYNLEVIKDLLSDIVKREKHKVYYIKGSHKTKDEFRIKYKVKDKIEDWLLFCLQLMYKEGCISIKRIKDDKYDYAFNFSDDDEKFNKDFKSYEDFYIREESIKGIIRNSVVSVCEDLLKKAYVPLISTVAISSIIPGGISFEIEEPVTKDKTEKKESYLIYDYIYYGDTLSGIAKKHNTTVDKLIELNPGIDPNHIYPGQRIVIGESDVNPIPEAERYNESDLFKGIDISENQGASFDLKTVCKENKEIDFVIIRSHNFVFAKGEDSRRYDKDFEKNMIAVQEIRKTNPNFGLSVYCFPDIREKRTLEEVEEDAKEFVTMLNEYRNQGVRFDYPIMLDIEAYDSDGSYVEQQEIPNAINNDVKYGTTHTMKRFKIWVDILKANGYGVGLYTSAKAYYETYYELCDYADVDKNLNWLADTEDKNANISLEEKKEQKKDYSGIIHQWGVKEIDGYQGPIDLNATNRNYPEYLRMKGLNNLSGKTETYKFDKNDFEYEAGILSISFDGRVLTIATDQDINEMKVGDTLEIYDSESGKVFTITKVNNNDNLSHLIFAGGISAFMFYLSSTPNMKDFYRKVLENQQEKRRSIK